MLRLPSGRENWTGSAANEHPIFVTTASSMPAWKYPTCLAGTVRGLMMMTRLVDCPDLSTHRKMMELLNGIYDDVKTKASRFTNRGTWEEVALSMIRNTEAEKNPHTARFVPGRCRYFLTLHKNQVQNQRRGGQWWQFYLRMWVGVRLMKPEKTVRIIRQTTKTREDFKMPRYNVWQRGAYSILLPVSDLGKQQSLFLRFTQASKSPVQLLAGSVDEQAVCWKSGALCARRIRPSRKDERTLLWRRGFLKMLANLEATGPMWRR